MPFEKTRTYYQNKGSKNGDCIREHIVRDQEPGKPKSLTLN